MELKKIINMEKTGQIPKVISNNALHGQLALNVLMHKIRVRVLKMTAQCFATELKNWRLIKEVKKNKNNKSA